jgi:hypothetical protein
VNNPSAAFENVRRVEAWASEVRVNLIRLAALLVFYSHHLINIYLYRDDPSLTPDYVRGVTAIVVAWACLVVLMHVALSRRWLPAWLPYAAACGDVGLVTALLTVGDVRSPLIVLYWLVIATTPLRLSLLLVVATTAATMFGYLIALGHYAYMQIGAAAYYADAARRVPRVHQGIVLLGLLTAGALAGQAVRQARRLVDGYPVTVATPEE